MALIEILQKYKFVRTPETEVSSLVTLSRYCSSEFLPSAYGCLNYHGYIAKLDQDLMMAFITASKSV